MQTLTISAPELPLKGTVHLPASKSESNRALIMQALAKYQSGTDIQVNNISSARDTQTMLRLLSSNDEVLDVIDAGTTMRFLTAYLAITTQSPKILTGTPRMCERPIGILVEALKSLGFQIEYVEKEGFPPLKVHRPQTTDHSKTTEMAKLKIRGDVSSQYISALLMIAPLLPQGLQLELEGKVGSRPYIEMTLEQMRFFGIQSNWQANIIEIKAQTYQAQSFSVESDWSGASYWYSMASLSKGCEIELLGLRESSLQGDRAIVEIMDQLGVRTEFNTQGAILHCKPIKFIEPFHLDFTACPDLAQTVISLCAIKRIPLISRGLESLKIKETDRVYALQTELQKFGAELHEEATYWSLRFGAWAETHTKLDYSDPILINTYDDHRMAMAFAPLALLHPLKIEHSEVVKKSYPSFWEDLKSFGFQIS